MSDASNAKPESLPVSSDDGMPTSVPNPISSLPPATLPTGTPVAQEAEPVLTREQQILKYVGDPRGEYVMPKRAGKSAELYLNDDRFFEELHGANDQVAVHAREGHIDLAERTSLFAIDLEIRRALAQIFGSEVVDEYFVGSKTVNSEVMHMSPSMAIVHKAVQERQMLLSKAYNVKNQPGRYNLGRGEGISAGVFENPEATDIEVQRILLPWANDQETLDRLFKAGDEIAALINEHLERFKAHGLEIVSNSAGRNVVFIEVEKPDRSVEQRSVQASVERGDIAMELARSVQRYYLEIGRAVSDQKREDTIASVRESAMEVKEKAMGGIKNLMSRRRGTNR